MMLTELKHCKRLWSYWKYESGAEVSIWQVVPKPENMLHKPKDYAVGFPGFGDDMFFKCIIDLSPERERYTRAGTGEIFSYSSKSLCVGWTRINKDDIPLVLLGDLP